jgi:hypothetical protein
MLQKLSSILHKPTYISIFVTFFVQIIFTFSQSMCQNLNTVEDASVQDKTSSRQGRHCWQEVNISGTHKMLSRSGALSGAAQYFKKTVLSAQNI